MTNAPSTSSSFARSTARDTAQIAVFAALIAALTLPGAIPVGSLGVPITLQTLGVMLAGAILGPRKGTIAVVVYVVLGLIGLPIFAGGTSGLAVLVGPTGGFLVGFIPAAFVVGWFSQHLLPRYPFFAALGGTIVGGVLVVYAIGIPWFSIVTGTPFGTSFLIAGLPFIPGDLLKAVIAVLVAKSVHRAWPGIIEPRPWPGMGARRKAEAQEPLVVDED